MKSFLQNLSWTKRILLALAAVIVIYGGYRLWFAPPTVQYDLATAIRGTMVQEVSVTGNTAPVTNLDLGFENGGTVAVANYDVGAHVDAGAVIARLDTSDLAAQLAQAQANVDAQTAKLKSLEAGSRPEDIQSSEAALAKARQDLANMYANVMNTLADGYAKANDATRNQLAGFFNGPETLNPQLTFAVSDSQTLNNAQADRVQATTALNAWQNEISALTAASPTNTLEQALADGTSDLAIINNLLVNASQAVTQATSLPSATVTAYKTSVTAALAEVNAGTTSVNAAAQNIASQKLTIAQLQADLALKIAGSTPEDIAAQQAQVEQAQANVQSIQVKINKASLVAPFSGVITRQDAKVGEIAAPGAVLVSLISDQGLEVDADIPEADIGKVSVGDVASMTLDAFQGQTFSGKITYIDPGEVSIEGVPTYKTTFMFDGLGPQVKPGMTANIDIISATHDNVVYIPQRAVLTDADSNRTVQVYHGSGQPIETRKVTVGIRDTNGNIEITSGLNEGEEVLRSPQQ